MKKLIVIITTVVFLSTSITFNVYSKSITELNNEKNEIESQIKDSQNSLSETQEEKSDILKQVEHLDSELEVIENELYKLEQQLEETKISLEHAELELAKAREKKENQYESLKQRLRIMYEYGDTGYLQILLEAKGFTDFFKRIEYINYIMEHDNKIFENYKMTEQLIDIKVEQIRIEKENIEILTKQAEEKRAEVEKALSQKSEILKELEQQEAYLEQKLKDLEQADKEITNLINSANVTATGSSTNKIYTSGSGGQLAHPVPAYATRPYNDVYGYRINPISGKSELHSGLDLKATYGCDIVAAEAGTVIFSGVQNGYGNTVIIDHGNGMTTLYAHNSSLVVSVGQTVQRGQVIAKAGATGYATGVHCHFEVRINGKHTDPAPYLQ